MIITLYWLTLWLYLGLALLWRWRGALHLRDISLALPLGLSVNTLGGLLLWLGGIDLATITRWSQIGLVLVLTYVVSDRLPLRSFPVRVGFNDVYRRSQQIIHQLVNWPLAWLVGMVIFSLAVVLIWQGTVEPVTWDNLSLYDWRAQRLAQGWQVSDFLVQFNDQPSWAMYDFLHPLLPSIIGAFVYQSGGIRVPLISAVLLLCVLSEVGKTWRSWAARIVFGVLSLGSPLFFKAAVEGYGVWWAVLFWWLFFLFVWRHSLHYRWEQLVAGFFLAAAVQSRLSEPYWIIVVIWLLGRYHWLTTLPVIFSFVNWQVLVRLAARFTSGQVVRSTYSATWLTVLLSNLSPTLVGVLFIDGLLHNPVLPYFLGVGLLAFWLRQAQAWSASLRTCLVLIISWGIILLGGMAAFWARNPSTWSEVVLALPRAVLPLAALCVVFITAAVDRLFGSEVQA